MCVCLETSIISATLCDINAVFYWSTFILTFRRWFLNQKSQCVAIFYSLYHGRLFLRESLAAPDARISSRSREKRSLHRGYISEPLYILTTLRNKKRHCSNLRVYPPRLLHILQFYDRTHKPCTLVARNFKSSR